MRMQRFGTASVVIVGLVLSLAVPPAFAATNLVANGSFEIPKVPKSGFATFPTGSTLGTCGLAMPGSPGYQTGCWRVFAGNVDVVQNGYWNAKAGKQSIELNGTTPGAVLQLFVVKPNEIYKLKFSLAGDPLISGTVSMLAVQEQFDASGTYITGSAIGSYDFDTTGHLGTSMGYQTKTGLFATGPNARYVDVELQSTTQDDSALYWGPAVDAVSVTDHGPASQ